MFQLQIQDLKEEIVTLIHENNKLAKELLDVILEVRRNTAYMNLLVSAPCLFHITLYDVGSYIHCFWFCQSCVCIQLRDERFVGLTNKLADVVRDTVVDAIGVGGQAFFQVREGWAIWIGSCIDSLLPPPMFGVDLDMRTHNS